MGNFIKWATDILSKTTISKAVLVLGFNGKLHKVGNRYMLSEMQISQIKSKISQFSQTDEEKKTQISPTLQTDEEKKTQSKYRQLYKLMKKKKCKYRC